VLDAIAALSATTGPMFGCPAVYVAHRIVLVLRDKLDKMADNGVWLATTKDHHESLRREFPNMNFDFNQIEPHRHDQRPEFR
jgi:hypothetical protein